MRSSTPSQSVIFQNDARFPFRDSNVYVFFTILITFFNNFLFLFSGLFIKTMNIEIHQKELQERVIRQLFKHGYPYKTILYILQHNHGIHISERTLYNRLQTFRLGCRNNLNDVNFRHVQDLIGNRLDGPGSLLGYRLLWNKLRSEDNVQVPRDVVMFLLQHMDPDGVQTRKSHRLNRRTYFSLGP